MTHSFPILVPNLPQQRFSCHACTNCCRDIVVHLTATDRAKIDAQGWAGRLDVSPYVRLGGKWVLNQTRDNRCVFLQEDGRCRIHAEHGASAKPIGCQLFPFVLLPVQRGWQLSYRFDCPSLASSKGSPIHEQMPALKQLAAQLPHPYAGTDRRASPPAAVFFQPGRPMTEKEAACLVDLLDGWLRVDSRPVHVRLRGLGHIVSTIAQLDARKIHGERFSELLRLLFGSLAAEGGESPAELSPPTNRQRKLLRQQVFTCLQAISVREALAGWRTKTARMLSQFRRSRQFVRLTGQAPPSIVTAAKIPFETVEAIRPARSDAVAVGELVIRYLRAQVLSHSFFGLGYYGWDAVLGLQALLSRLAVWGWLARYCAAAEGKAEIDHAAVLRSIGIVARAAGISRALGSRTERLRLEYIQHHQGLERLVAACTLIPAIPPEVAASQRSGCVDQPRG